ncbi:MAG: helix-turn-helix domain-containing protein [Bdellovibrionales bacterium]|nr:helix-turn-helix domain-containing protein [Bdellovibrionales bacterium]
MNDFKRTVFLLLASSERLSPLEASILEKVKVLSTIAIEVNPESAEIIDRVIEGGVLIVPPGKWPAGTLAYLTRFTDLPFIALVEDGSSLGLVKFWYSLGADLVLDTSVSSAVLVAAVEKRRELDRRSTLSQLTKKEIVLFEILRRAGASGVTRSQLAERIWPDVHVHDKTIDVHVFNLRRKLNGSNYRIEVQNSTLRLIDKSGLETAEDLGR